MPAGYADVATVRKKTTIRMHREFHAVNFIPEIVVDRRRKLLLLLSLDTRDNLVEERSRQLDTSV